MIMRVPLAEDPNIRLVIKQFPVLGPDSVRAASLAIVARQQHPEKYAGLHELMMESGGKMSEAQVLELAQNWDLTPPT